MVVDAMMFQLRFHNLKYLDAPRADEHRMRASDSPFKHRSFIHPRAQCPHQLVARRCAALGRCS